MSNQAGRKFNFARFQMRATTATVDVIKSCVDVINVGIGKVYAPIGRGWHHVSNEYPILAFFGTGCLVGFAPFIAFTSYKRHIENDKRRSLERERVRLCLEKGVDPYPMVRYKEHVHGNISQTTSFSEADAPKDASYEHRAVENLRKKSELYAKVMGINEGARLDSSSYEDPSKSLDSLLALRERERAKYSGNKLISWQDPVDLAFPKRPDEIYPANASERLPSPADENEAFRQSLANKQK